MGVVAMRFRLGVPALLTLLVLLLLNKPWPSTGRDLSEHNRRRERQRRLLQRASMESRSVTSIGSAVRRSDDGVWEEDEVAGAGYSSGSAAQSRSRRRSGRDLSLSAGSDLAAAAGYTSGADSEESGIRRRRLQTLTAEQTAWVGSHNSARAQVGVKPVTWSTTVAASAGNWASYLQKNNGCSMQHEQNGIYGENLFWGWSSQKASYTPAAVVKMWVGEKVYYNYATNSCSKVCGHYTQVVWNTTTSIGCATVYCDSYKTQLSVCRYNPPGNWIGVPPY